MSPFGEIFSNAYEPKEWSSVFMPSVIVDYEIGL